MKIRVALLLLSLSCAPLAAQSGFVTVTGTRIYDAYGNLATGATICARPMVGGVPAGITVGSGGGQVTVQQVCQPVTSGAFTLSLPNTALTSPANACLAVQVKDSHGQIILSRGYECVQPTSIITNGSWCSTTAGVTTCNFDHFQSNLPTLAAVQTGPPGPTGPQGIPGPTGPSGAGVYDVSNYCSSCTLDAQIAAATTALASYPAELISTHPGHILNPVTLSAGHILHLKAVTGFDAQITLNTGSGVWCDEQITHTTALTGSYLITTTGTDAASVRGCNVLSNVGAGNNLVSMTSVTHPRVLNNTMQNGGIIFGLHMTDIDIEHNRNNGGFGQNLNDVDRGLIAHNATDGSPSDFMGIDVFNVDADPSHVAAGSWPSSVTKGHLTIDDNYEINVQSCTFLSGVKAAIVTNSHCHAPGDIGLDDEGGVDNVWQGGEAMECAGNYCVGAEFETQNVMFDHIKVEAVSGHILLVAANNNNALGQNVTFNDIDASCSGVNPLCPGYVVYGYSLPVTIQNSTFHNAIITAAQQAQSSTLNFKNDDFFFGFSSDYASSTANAFTAINPCQGAGGCINHSTILFDNVRIFGTNVPAGSTGIYLHHYDYNATSVYSADNNKVFGFTNGFTHSGDSGNIGGTFLMHNNLTDGLITTGGTNAYFEGFHNCQQISVCDLNVATAVGVGTTSPNTFNGTTTSDQPNIQTSGRLISGGGELHLINSNAPANRQAWRLQVDGSGNLTIDQCNAGYTSCTAAATYAPSH